MSTIVEKKRILAELKAQFELKQRMLMNLRAEDDEAAIPPADDWQEESPGQTSVSEHWAHVAPVRLNVDEEDDPASPSPIEAEPAATIAEAPAKGQLTGASHEGCSTASGSGGLLGLPSDGAVAVLTGVDSVSVEPVAEPVAVEPVAEPPAEPGQIASVAEQSKGAAVVPAAEVPETVMEVPFPEKVDCSATKLQSPKPAVIRGSRPLTKPAKRLNKAAVRKAAAEKRKATIARKAAQKKKGAGTPQKAHSPVPLMSPLPPRTPPRSQIPSQGQRTPGVSPETKGTTVVVFGAGKTLKPIEARDLKRSLVDENPSKRPRKSM